jgi:hypothetical protein
LGAKAVHGQTGPGRAGQRKAALRFGTSLLRRYR